VDDPDLCTLDAIIHLVWKTRDYQFVDDRLLGKPSYDVDALQAL
jgi:hypothetical protein